MLRFWLPISLGVLLLLQSTVIPNNSQGTQKGSMSPSQGTEHGDEGFRENVHAHH